MYPVEQRRWGGGCGSRWGSRWAPCTETIPGTDGLVKTPRSEGVVFKKGSATGHYMAGGCLEGYIPSVLRDFDGLPKGCPPGNAWLVLGTRDTQFSDHGDSGAFCLDPEGNWVGLIFAGHPSLSRTYVIDAEDVIKDIEHITGWTFVGMPTRV